MPFGTQYGHRPLPPERAAEDAWRAVARQYEVLIGWTTEETAFFGELSPALGRLFAVPWLGERVRKVMTRVTTNMIYHGAGRRFAALLEDAGCAVSRYELDWRPRGSPSGAAHLTDLPLLFPTGAWTGARLIGTTKAVELEELGRPMRAAWAGFARSGAVGGSSLLLRVRAGARHFG
jgi:para-nitrobenzyl esterase